MFKLTSAGYKSLTGNFGGVEFVNGEFEGPIDIETAKRIGNSINLQEVLEDGTTRQVSMFSDFLAEHGKIPNKNYTRKSEHGQVITYDMQQNGVEVSEDAVDDESGAESPIINNPNLDAINVYTREQLEEIADKSGISGLREIADKYGIKARSISELIEALTGITV